MTWKTIFSFALFATLLAIFVGWLILTGVLPIQQNVRFNDAGRRFMSVWIKLAIAIGLILPSILWFVWIKNPQPRKILGFYLSVLTIQIVTEQIFSRVGFPSLVVIIGTLYTAFRIWQLWQGQQLIYTNSSSPSWMSAMLWLLGLFWSGNLIMLLTLGWSSIVRQN